MQHVHSQTEMDYLEEALEIGLSDTGETYHYQGGVFELQQYLVALRDTALIFRAYELEKEACLNSPAHSRFRKICTYNMISAYGDHLPKGEVLAYIRNYADTNFLVCEYILGSLARIYIREGKIDSAVYYLQKIPLATENSFSDVRTEEIEKTVKVLIEWCREIPDKEQAWDFFMAQLSKFPQDDPFVGLAYGGMTTPGAVDIECERFNAALNLGFYDKAEYLLKKRECENNQTMTADHCEKLINAGYIDSALFCSEIIPRPYDRITLLSKALWKELPADGKNKILQTVIDIARSNRHNLPAVGWWTNRYGFHTVVYALLDEHRVQEAAEFTKILNTKKWESGKAYIAIANYYLKSGDKEQALKYIDSGFLQAKKDKSLSMLAEVASVYYRLKMDAKVSKTMSFAEKLVVNDKQELYDTEDLILVAALAGRYDRALDEAIELDNSGTDSKRSAAHEIVYKAAFANGDTAAGLSLLDKAVKDLLNIEHLHQRHWYIREAAVQYALLRRYNDAFSVAGLLETNQLEHIFRTAKEMVEAFRQNEEENLPLSWYDRIIEFAEACPRRERIHLGCSLTDLFLNKGANSKAWNLEEKMISYVYGTADIDSISDLTYLFHLYERTDNREAYKKLLEIGYERTGLITDTRKKMNALLELQKKKDRL